MDRKRIYCALGYRCNNNCLVCAVDSVNKMDRNISTEELCLFFDRFSNKPGFEFEISGGEPTIRKDFLYLMNYLKINSPKNPYLLLSNGRKFSNINFTNSISEIPPKSLIIAIHGNTSKLHDLQTQVFGSFDETIQGIKNLFDYGINVDLKIIVTQLNYKFLSEIIDFSVRSFPELRHMSINGLDLQGSAVTNKEKVFVSLNDIKLPITKAIDTATNYDLSIRTYSLPICLFDESHRRFVGEQPRKDLICKSPTTETDNVVWNYGPINKCVDCKYISFCSGTWHSYFDFHGADEISPILERID